VGEVGQGHDAKARKAVAGGVYANVDATVERDAEHGQGHALGADKAQHIALCKPRHTVVARLAEKLRDELLGVVAVLAPDHQDAQHRLPRRDCVEPVSALDCDVALDAFAAPEAAHQHIEHAPAQRLLFYLLAQKVVKKGAGQRRGRRACVFDKTVFRVDHSH